MSLTQKNIARPDPAGVFTIPKNAVLLRTAFFKTLSDQLESFGIQAFAKLLAGTSDCLGLTAGFFLRVLFVMAAQLHFAEDAFALHFLLQNFQRLTDVITDNSNLNHLNHLISNYYLVISQKLSVSYLI